MSATADIVVAGAGHNSLIAAAYLAKAGFSVVVVDARPIPGGGAATEDLLVPGLGIDTCSTGHTLIQLNPVIADDELGLVEEFGLAYAYPDPVAHVRFPDGEHFTMSLDRDRTVDEFARFSANDARAYQRMLDEFDEVKHVLGRSRFVPLGHGPSIDELLAGHPREASWQRRRLMSVADVARHEFEDPHSRAFLMWMAFQTLVGVDLPGTGLLAYSLISGRQQRSWSIPLGGSGRLVDGLVAYLERHGARIECNTTVESLIVEDGRCVGITTSSGEFRAAKAVLSTIHIKHLVGMAPAGLWGDDFLYAVDTYDVGISGFASYLATTEPPVFTTTGGGVTAVSAGLAGWPQDMIDACRAMRDQRFFEESPFVLVATPTLVDMSRSVDGLHTVKLLSAQTYELPEGRSWADEKVKVTDRFLERLRAVAPNLTEDTIVARMDKSPEDIEAWNAHMIRGAFHGGDRSIAHSGPMRPVPGWAQHRMPIEGLYQTGGTTHPGGSITGAPGRNAAMVMLADLGADPSEVMNV